MEDINQRLETLPPKRQEQFQRVLKRTMRYFSPKTEEHKQEIIEHTKSKILDYLAKEEQEKITPRKHGSKGKKHRERGPEQVKRIEKKLDQYKINYVALLKELFNVDLREKHSYNGIRYIGLCPFHDEKTPSLSVAADKGVIKCYGCGKGHRPVYLISNVFEVKYSRALGMLEKYIFTPEEDEDRRKKNEIIRDIFQTTSEQIDRHTFARSRRDKVEYYGNPQYLSKKQFNEELIKRKEEQDLKEKEKEARLKKTTNSNDDDLAF